MGLFRGTTNCETPGSFGEKQEARHVVSHVVFWPFFRGKARRSPLLFRPAIGVARHSRAARAKWILQSAPCEAATERWHILYEPRANISASTVASGPVSIDPHVFNSRARSGNGSKRRINATGTPSLSTIRAAAGSARARTIPGHQPRFVVNESSMLPRPVLIVVHVITLRIDQLAKGAAKAEDKERHGVGPIATVGSPFSARR